MKNDGGFELFLSLSKEILDIGATYDPINLSVTLCCYISNGGKDLTMRSGCEIKAKIFATLSEGIEL